MTIMRFVPHTCLVGVRRSIYEAQRGDCTFTGLLVATVAKA